MRDFSEIYNFITSRNLQCGISINKLSEYIKFGLTQLKVDEEVVYGFGGLHNYISISKHNGNVLYLITTKKLILIQKRMFGQFLVNIDLKDIREINLSLKNSIGIITIHTFRESFNIAFNIVSSQVIFNDIKPLIEQKYENKNLSNQDDVIKKLKDLKSLLDDGILTQAEFELQKKKILEE